MVCRAANVTNPAERLTTAACASSGWSRPLLPDHAELAASEQAERDAARARRGDKPIRRVQSARFDKMTHRRRRPADSIVSPPPRQPIVDLMLLPRNATADQPQLAYIFSLPPLTKKELEVPATRRDSESHRGTFQLTDDVCTTVNPYQIQMIIDTITDTGTLP
jgi:hypothetical protein